jgi:hypothetical protein
MTTLRTQQHGNDETIEAASSPVILEDGLLFRACSGVQFCCFHHCSDVQEFPKTAAKWKVSHLHLRIKSKAFESGSDKLGPTIIRLNPGQVTRRYQNPDFCGGFRCGRIPIWNKASQW